MEFLIGLLIGISIGFLWGVWRATQGFIERMMENPDEIKDLLKRVEKINNDTDKELKKINRDGQNQDVKAEFHDGVCYLYDQDDQFLAQGNTIIEAIDRAEKRFPDLKLNFRVNDSKESAQ